MIPLGSIFTFLSKILDFIPWFTKRQDAKKLEQAKTSAVKQYEKNEDKITELYRNSDPKS